MKMEREGNQNIFGQTNLLLKFIGFLCILLHQHTYLSLTRTPRDSNKHVSPIFIETHILESKIEKHKNKEENSKGKNIKITKRK